MLRSATAVLATVLLFLLGCASFPVSTDYDPGFDFSKLRSWDWAPVEPTISIGDPRLQGDLMRARVERAVQATLTARGFERVKSGADFWIVYHLASETKLDVDTIYRTGPYGRYTWPEQTIVREYEQGTLLLDVLDPKSGLLVWRGSSHARIRERAEPEARDERARAAVEAILAQFPPGAGS